MADVYELSKSREVHLGTDGSAKLLFICVGTSDDAEARAAFAAEIPASVLDMGFEDGDVTHAGGDVWYMTANYLTSTTEALAGQGGEAPGSGEDPPPSPPPAPGPTDPLGTA